MKYSVITSDYNYETNDINIYCRDENGKKHKKIVTGFEPYFYAPIADAKEYQYDPRVAHISKTDVTFVEDKSALSKIITHKPKYVGEIHRENKIPCYESDVPFTRRFLIDQKIYTGFEVDTDKKSFYPHKLKPVDFRIKPRKAYIDIETRIKEKKVTIVCIYDDKTDIYITVALDPKGRLKTKKTFSKNHVVYIVKTEKDLLQATEQIFCKIDPDVVTAWYIEFDKEYLIEQNKKNDARIPWERYNVIDLMEIYKKLYNKGSNKLKDVVKAENLPVPAYQPFEQSFWEDDLDKAILVNKSHVESIVILDKQRELINFYWNLKDVSGYEDINGTIHHGSIIDILRLRYYSGKYALRSKPRGAELEKNFELAKGLKVGGKVFSPPFGLFNNIGVYDLSRYYPELLISQNLTFELLEDKSKLGILPQMTLDFIEERLKLDRELDKLEPGTAEYKQKKEQRDAVKFVLNTIFGTCGDERDRCFNIDLFNKITKMGQKGLIFLRDKASKDGNTVLYGDSVSGDTQITIYSRSGKEKHLSIECFFEKYKKRIKEQREKEIIDINPDNIRTISLTKKGNIGIGKISKIIRHKTNKQLYKITTETGKCITVTEDHSLLIKSKSKILESSPKMLNTDTILLCTDNYVSYMSNMRKKNENLKSSTSKNTQYNNNRICRTISKFKLGIRRIKKKNARKFSFWDRIYVKTMERPRIQKKNRKLGKCICRKRPKQLEQGNEYRPNEGIPWRRKISRMVRKTCQKNIKMGKFRRRSILYKKRCSNTCKTKRTINNRLNFNKSTKSQIPRFTNTKNYYNRWVTNLYSRYSSKWFIYICGWMLLALLPTTFSDTKERFTNKKYKKRQTSKLNIEKELNIIHSNMGTRNQQLYFGSFEKDRPIGIKFEKIKSIKKIPIKSEYVYDLEVIKHNSFLANDIFVHNTDSNFLQMPNNETAKKYIIPKYQDMVDNLLEQGADPEKVYTMCYADTYTKRLNNYLKEFTKIHNLSRNLELKLDYLFSTVLFKKKRERIDGKWVERGAKKRYAGIIIYNNKPCNYLDIKGFEYVRKDTALTTKDVQPKVFDLILSNKVEKMKKYVKDTVNNLKSDFEIGKITYDDIAIPKTLSKNPWDYGGLNKNGKPLTPPQYARGALFANEWLGESIRGGDQVKMIFVKKLSNYPKTSVICYSDMENLPENLEVDMEQQIERILKMPLEKILDSINIKWDDLFHRQRSLF